MKTILDQSLGLIFLLSPKGLCLEASSAALSYNDQRQDRILGKPIWEIPWLRHSRAVQKKFQEAIARVATGESLKFEVQIADNEGHKSWFEFSLKAVYEEGEEVSLLLAEGHNLAERKQGEQELKRMALYDPLTDLANRTLLYEHLGNALAHANRYHEQFSVIYIDLDNFKTINDTLGHDTGDKLLVNIATCFKECMREEDVIARVGGDEFVVVLKSASDKEATRVVVERLMHSVTEIAVREGYGKIISASLGISVYPNDGDDADTLLRNADTAMYAAKNRGKNCFHYYDDELSSSRPYLHLA
ncbi:MAG: diguanylate cyclase domain-containing protein [Gammaproteobacteria bacterium]